jgi:hypothetical protein
MPGIRFFDYKKGFETILNKPVLFVPLDIKAVWLFIVVLVAVIEMEKP